MVEGPLELEINSKTVNQILKEISALTEMLDLALKADQKRRAKPDRHKERLKIIKQFRRGRPL